MLGVSKQADQQKYAAKLSAKHLAASTSHAHTSLNRFGREAARVPAHCDGQPPALTRT